MSLGHGKETLPKGLRETFPTPGARLLSWSLWPSHPTASPWFGWGTGLAIPRKCLPPVQAGIPAYTPPRKQSYGFSSSTQQGARVLTL